MLLDLEMYTFSFDRWAILIFRTSNGIRMFSIIL